ncbi:AAA family ATPase [Halorhodospira neutriphila]|uniref:AAA family ATPase n=1 Tax=Halorhodospira neutriphila TaxID=168379 RepID=UPI001907EAFD
MDEVTGLVGRDRELSAARETLGKGANLLVTGAAGIGKSALLRALYRELGEQRPCLWVHEGSAKEQAYELALQAHQQVGLVVPERLIPHRFLGRARREGVHWHWIQRSVRRMPARECVALVADSLARAEPPALVFFESLELPPAQADQLAAVLEAAQVAAAMDRTNRRERIRRLLWRFPERERLELRPLPGEAARAIAERWLAHYPVRFEPPRVRAAFLRAVVQDSGGVPAAIEGMLEQAASEPAVTRAKVRAFAHEAGVRYLDMTPVVVLGVAAIMAARYIARGVGSRELYVLAGVGMGLAVVVRFFVMPLMSRRR